MLSELYDLGLRLREEGKLPPPGYTDNSKDPIRWTISLRSPEDAGAPPRASLREGGGDRWRPDSGRSGKKYTAYPLVDHASYVLGVPLKEDGDPTPDPDIKHQNFRQRLDELTETVDDPDLIEAIRFLAHTLDHDLLKSDPLLDRVAADHWVSVEMMDGPLSMSGQHLFEHDEVQRWWVAWLSEDVAKGRGTCSITGKDGPLVGRIPGRGGFRGSASLLGLNEDAYVSYVGGGSAAKKASIGVSYDAADVANRALAYLDDSKRHRRTLVYDKDSDLRTLTALFWLGEDEPVEVSEEGIFEPDDLLAFLGEAIEHRIEDEAPDRDLVQVHNLLKLPWKPKRASLRLDAYGFYLAILSKNPPVRVVVREWLALDLKTVKKRLSAFLDAATLVPPNGGTPRPVSIQSMVDSLTAIYDEKGKRRGSVPGSPNLGRDLLRTAFTGTTLPQTILQPCLARLRVLFVRGNAPWWQEHALVALLKLTLSHQTNAAMPETLAPHRNERAYLCGRLLAVLGRIQQDALTDDNRNRKKKGNDEEGRSLNRTLTQRVFAAASTAPEAYLAPLVQRATVAHIPKLSAPGTAREDEDRRWGQTRADCEVKTLMARIHETGGFPHSLDLHGQAEFALGFYHQRADPSNPDNPCAKSDDTASNNANPPSDNG